MSEPKFLIFTDGGASKKTGLGGFGVIIKYPDGQELVFSEGYRNTTTNRMELMGPILALGRTPEGSNCLITSDSRYVVYGINSYLKKWIEHDYQTTGWVEVAPKKFEPDGKWHDIANRDLWEKLAGLIAKRTVTAAWVKGHQGHPENERCDTMASKARRYDAFRLDLPNKTEPKPEKDPELSEF